MNSSEFTASLQSISYPHFSPSMYQKCCWNALLIFDRGVEEALNCPVTLTANKGDKTSLFKTGMEEIEKEKRKIKADRCMVRWRLWSVVTCRSTASQTRTHDWRKWSELKEWPEHVNKKPTMFNYLQSRNVYGVCISWSFQQSPPDLCKVFANNIHPKKSKTSHFLDFKGRILKLILDHLWSQLEMTAYNVETPANSQ